MSRNNNYQQIQEIASSIPSSTKDLLRTQQKNIVCNDCGGISAAKVQHLLSTLEGTTQLFNTASSSSNSTSENTTKSNNIYRKTINQSKLINKKKNSARNNSKKPSLRRTPKNNNKNKNMNKRIQNSTKQRKLSINRIRSSISSQSKNNKTRKFMSYTKLTEEGR
ncbi:unnamed protein product [Rotaria sp. Silwood1]|nr:unnamed protein product [Rotaria sp. Silwood1]